MNPGNLSVFISSYLWYTFYNCYSPGPHFNSLDTWNTKVNYSATTLRQWRHLMPLLSRSLVLDLHFMCKVINTEINYWWGQLKEVLFIGLNTAKWFQQLFYFKMLQPKTSGLLSIAIRRGCETVKCEFHCCTLILKIGPISFYHTV